MTLRGLLPSLLLAALSLILTLGGVELVVRILASGPEERVDTAIKGHLSTRGRGPDYRYGEPPGPKPPGTFRIVVIGDSFGWGAGVHPEDVYPRRLERRLAELPAEARLEVVNWSRPGWNIEQQWRWAERRLARVDPDLLILGFTLNDPEPTGEELREMIYEPLGRRAPEASVSRALYRASALYRLIWQRLENRRQRRAFSRYYRELFEGESWQQCRERLAQFRRLTRELDIPMLLVVFPVFDSQLDDAYPYRGQHRTLARAAAELEIPALDLLETYRGIDGRRLAVTPFTDPHPNELAHRIASDELAIHLVAEGLVPASFPMRRTPTAVRRLGGGER